MLPAKASAASNRATLNPSPPGDRMNLTHNEGDYESISRILPGFNPPGAKTWSVSRRIVPVARVAVAESKGADLVLDRACGWSMSRSILL